MPPSETAEKIISESPHLGAPALWTQLAHGLDWQSVLERSRNLCYRDAVENPEGECARHRDRIHGGRTCGSSMMLVLTARYGPETGIGISEDVTNESEAAAMSTKDLRKLQREATEMSQRWFPDVHQSMQHAVVHMALGLAGETGELVDHIKKANRSDDFDKHVRSSKQEIGAEIADVQIYLALMAQALGIDIAAEVERKQAFNEERFGSVGLEKEQT